MMKQQWIWIGILGYLLMQAQLANASQPENVGEPQSAETSDRSSNEVRLVVDLQLDKAVYGQTRYKNPPQFAVWLEHRDSGEIRTLYVTQKLGRGSWNGKPTVPVSLPHWVGRYNQQSNSQGDPTAEHPLPDAITQPTPTDQFRITSHVAGNTRWYCCVEVNVSGDYNQSFPQKQADKTDAYGNGQPSIVYRAAIETRPGAQAAFKLVGHTSQHDVSPKLRADTSQITSAQKLFSRMRCSCVAK